MFCKTLLLLLFLAACAANGQTASRPAPLPNGLRVVVRERRTGPLVAIDLWIRAGAREERPGEEGCAHFLEHTLFKGTTTRGVGEADIAIENLGATLTAATGPDFAHFTTTVAGVHLSKALEVLADVVRNATLPDAEIERERGVILDELAQREADDSARLLDLLYIRAFPGHSYARSPGGSAEAIRVRTRAGLRAFYTRNYRPERCVLALAGDLSPERAQTEALRAFGDWFSDRNEGLPSPAPSLHPALSEPQSAAAAGHLARLGVGFRAPAAKEALMACAAQVTAALLGDSDGFGRLSIPALTGTLASARYLPRQDESLFLITSSLTEKGTSSSIASLAELESALNRVLGSLLDSPPRAAELAAAKRRVLGRANFERETTAGLARAIGYAEVVGGDTPEAFQARVQRLTAADIRQFVQTCLTPERRVIVRLLPITPKGGADVR